MSFFVTKVVDQWGTTTYSITTAGYTVLVLAMLALVIAAGFIGKSENKKRMNTKSIVFAGLAMALAMVTSTIKIFKLPMGGSVTLMSMLFICLIGYWYGIKIGLMTSVAYAFLQLIIDPYIISLPQMLLDYIFAFGALGLSGLFSNKKHGLLKGYTLGVLGRYFCSVLSGVIFFGMYAPETMSPLAYSLVYNGVTIGAEGILTLIIIAIPPVAHAITYVKSFATDQKSMA
ncbi:thiamine transporter [Lachnotalea glycerini]|uniref:Thiamine transporter n=1 Tax=Lachnotalea glycerini TaxID=1763509 RepID=A0A255IJK7_9FIRM|nr:energy-coupled thiamine transporter ThiT [Lachnotalea glycerini]PXV86230.1 thiamine transporter [Lachnotalea glycerini]RDY31594.1 energy-coupled thiamine transporter ThiT [Lachnotalea glycerini]